MKRNFDLYTDSYYESLNGTFQDITNISYESYGSINTFLQGILALLLRAGYILIQLGSIPIENIYIIILQNIVDIAVTIASFGLIGYILAFGNDFLGGLVGYGTWLLFPDAIEIDNALLGFSASLIATGIITSNLAGRLHLVGYILTTILFSMLVQPVIMHWVWHAEGWLHKREFLEHSVSVKDHAGALVIHVTGGLVGLIGALFLGRRLLKLSDISTSSIGSEAPGTTVAGYIFVALGLIGFSLPMQSYEASHGPNNYIGLILINNIMAMAGGIIVVVVVQFLFYRDTFTYWLLLRCVQGALVGLVTISAGVDVYSPITAYMAASLTALIFYFVVLFVHNSWIEDYCNTTAIHLICGILGTILPPLVGSAENLGSSVTSHVNIIHLGWQMLSLVCVMGFIIPVFCVLYFSLSVTGFLRNKYEELNHTRGVTMANQGPSRCSLQRLFRLYDDTSFIEPGGNPDVPLTHLKDSSMQQRNRAGETQIFDAIHESDKADIIIPPRKRYRFVYTLQNSKHDKLIENESENNYSCGDHSKSCEILPQQTSIKHLERTNKLKSGYKVLNKNTSCYDLHRTKKSTNLCEDIGKNMAFSHLNVLQRSFEYITYDNAFNDEIITIKAPKTTKV